MNFRQPYYMPNKWTHIGGGENGLLFLAEMKVEIKDKTASVKARLLNISREMKLYFDAKLVLISIIDKMPMEKLWNAGKGFWEDI